VLSEIEQVADDVVVLSKGRAVHSGPISELADASGGAVVVDAENRAPLITALSAARLDFDVLRSGVTVRDSDAATVGAVAADAGVALTMLQQRGPSLEEVFLDLVYGRRADSPRLDTSANPVAHASHDATPDDGAADAALVAGGVPLAGAAAVIADGGAVAAAGVGYGAAPVGTVPAETDAESPDAADEPAGDDADADADESTDAPASDTDATEQTDAAEHTDADAVTGDDAAEEGSEDESAGAAEASESAAAEDAADPSSSDEAGAAENGDDDLADETTETDTAHDEPSDETRRLVLPLATEAVMLPGTTVEPSFTELITGLPASVTTEGSDNPLPATEAVSIVTPELADDEDDDAIDEGDDDPRLAAMRTSLSAAASRFFDGPAPDYPYSSRAERREEAVETAAEGAPSAEQSDDEQRADEQPRDEQAAGADHEGGERPGEHQDGDEQHRFHEHPQG
jgi:hypothetical protein